MPPFGGLRGNEHGSSMARWKARGRLPISANWTFFASYRLRRYEPILVEIVVIERGWATFSANFRGKGASPPTNFGIKKLESLGYRMMKKIAENFNRLSRVHQRHRQTTDKQMDLRWHIANVTYTFTFAKRQKNHFDRTTPQWRIQEGGWGDASHHQHVTICAHEKCRL